MVEFRVYLDPKVHLPFSVHDPTMYWVQLFPGLNYPKGPNKLGNLKIEGF